MRAVISTFVLFVCRPGSNAILAGWVVEVFFVLVVLWDASNLIDDVLSETRGRRKKRLLTVLKFVGAELSKGAMLVGFVYLYRQLFGENVRLISDFYGLLILSLVIAFIMRIIAGLRKVRFSSPLSNLIILARRQIDGPKSAPRGLRVDVKDN